MTAVLRGLVSELRQMVCHRRCRIMFLLLLASAALGVFTYHRKVVNQLPVVLVDLDRSVTSRRIALFLSASREVQLAQRAVGSLGEAEALFQRGAVAAIVLVPEELSRQLKSGRRGEILVALDASNILLARNVSKAIDKCLGTLGVGVQVTALQKLGVPSRKALARALPLRVDDHFSFNPTTNYVVYLGPGVAFFFLHLFVLIMAASSRLPYVVRASRGERLGADAALLLVALAVGALFFYVLLPFEGITPQSGPLALFALLILLVTVDCMMARAIGALSPSPLLALQLTVIVGMLSLMLSGLTWPTDMFPPVLRLLGEIIPFTAFSRGLRLVLHYPATFDDLQPALRLFAVQAGSFAALWAVRTPLGRLPRTRRARS